MAKQRIDNFLGGTIKSSTDISSASYTQNMYFEVLKDGEDVSTKLKSIEGTRIKYDMGLSGDAWPRGYFVASKGRDGYPRLFVCFGSAIYAIDKTVENEFVKTLVCTVNTSTETISMCETGGDDPFIVVVDGSDIKAFKTKATTRNSVVVIDKPKRADGSYIKPTFVTYQYNYLTVNDTGSDYIYRSCQYPLEYKTDGETLHTKVFTEDPLTEDSSENGFYIPADWCPDNITAMVSTNAKLFTFGPKSMQVFNSTNDASIPFSSPDSSALSIGILAPASAASIGNEVFWLGSSTIGQYGIYKTVDTNPERISNPEMEREISEMLNPEDAVGFTWSENSHVFYAITFIQDNKTFVYDLSTGMWHNRTSRDANTGAQNKWRYRYAFLWDNSLCYLCGDGIVEQAKASYKLTNGIKEVVKRPSWTEHDGAAITRLRRGGAVKDGFTMFAIDNIQFQITNGEGPASGSALRPSCSFRYSKDGVLFGQPRTGAIAPLGTYAYLTQFPRLGVGSRFVFELSCSSNTPFDISGCIINWTPILRGF